MKILFLNDPNKITLASDLLLHGLCFLGFDVVDYPKLDYMYGTTNFNRSVPARTAEQIRNLYGSFAQRINIDRTELEQKIKSKYFDLVVIADPRCANELLPTALNCIEDKKLVWIDGSNSVFPEYFIPKGWYFKKEIEHGFPHTYNISLALPKENIPKHLSMFKTGMLVNQVKLANCSTDDSFYTEIRNNHFMSSKINNGWDQLINYEAIAHGSIPILKNIEQMPAKTMQNFPKNILQQINHLIKEKGLTWVYTDNSLYHEYQYQLWDWLRKNSTTENMAQLVVQTVTA